MNYCPKLKNIISLNEFNGDFNFYNNYLYQIFKSELYNNKLYYKKKSVALKRYPEDNGKEFSFLHLTCKDFKNTRNEEDRLPDLRRCERIHWIKPGIEVNHLKECNQNCFLTYVKKYKNRDRYHLLNTEDRYMIILEDREDYFLLITAFYIDHDNILEKKLRDFERYKID